MAAAPGPAKRSTTCEPSAGGARRTLVRTLAVVLHRRHRSSTTGFHKQARSRHLFVILRQAQRKELKRAQQRLASNDFVERYHTLQKFLQVVLVSELPRDDVEVKNVAIGQCVFGEGSCGSSRCSYNRRQNGWTSATAAEWCSHTQQKRERQHFLVLSRRLARTPDLSTIACPLATRDKRPLDMQALTWKRQKLTDPSSVIKKNRRTSVTECHFLKTVSSCRLAHLFSWQFSVWFDLRVLSVSVPCLH